MITNDIVICKECGKNLKYINNFHLATHNLTKDKYIEKYPDTEIIIKKLRQKFGDSFRNKKRPLHSLRMSGKNNPMSGGHSDKSKNKISLNRKGKGKGVCGKYNRTDAIKTKTSKSVSQAYVDGRIKPFNNFKTGHYYSTKMNTKYFFRSSWEEIIMEYLDIHQSVTRWYYEPMKLEYIDENFKKRYYVPDFLIYIDDIIKEIWEVKPQRDFDDHGIKHEQFECKMRVLYALVSKGEIDHVSIITEDELDIAKNFLNNKSIEVVE